jgi:hypothetical protein
MKRITFLTASVLLLISCNNVVYDFNNEEGGRKEGFQIKLNMPDATVVTYSSATENECYIDSLWVLEFTPSEALVNDTLIPGANILNNGKSTQLLPQLPFKPTNGNRIVCIANSDAKTRPHPNRSSINHSNINTYFPLAANGYYFGGEHLPMYGEITNWPSGYSCEMIRAVAKIQIQLGANPSDETGNFNAENVTYKVHNEAKGGLIQPSGTISGIAQTAPSHTVEDYYLLQKQNATEKMTNVYLYEFPSSNTTGLGVNIPYDSAFHAQRQYIILKKNAGGVATYYRLDFYDRLTKKFLDTRRNYHYIFTINSIRSEGYASEPEAQSNPGSNIEYTIEVKDGASHITSNGQYAIVTSVDTAYVEASAPDTKIATARYQFPTGMSLVSGTTNSISATGTGLTLTSPNALTVNDQDVKVTTTAGFTGGQINFKLGNITHTIHVKKK